MASFKLQIGPKLVLSIGLLLLAMIGTTSIALWRLQSVQQMADYLVSDKLAKRNLGSDWLNAVNLNGLRAVSIAKSDSLELADYFGAALASGDQRSEALFQQLTAMPFDEAEKALLEKLDGDWQRYLRSRSEVLQLKERGRTPEAEKLFAANMEPQFQLFVSGIQTLLDYQSRQAAAISAQALKVYSNSIILILCLGLASIAIGIMLARGLTNSIVIPIRNAVVVAEKVAQGDLTSRIAINLKSDETGQLMTALKSMNEGLGTIVNNIRVGTDAIANASTRIAAGSADLSSRTEQQAASLEETASSMEELTNAVKLSAENAQHAGLLAAAASEVAEKGGGVVAQVMDTMGAIDASGRQMANIIEVINGIAFQTNILALNAAVEAARAGDQGRGFAVVAGEVRALAQRSASAASEVEVLIRNSLGNVAAGSALVAQAGITMQEIVASVDRVREIMSEIAVAAQQQQAGIEQINLTVGQLDRVTQQNAALGGDAAMEAAGMQKEAAALVTLVAQWTVAAARPQSEERCQDVSA